jgi:hypothetical protein
MSGLRGIDPKPFIEKTGAVKHPSAATKPQLRWIGIDLLRIDATYQRAILDRGAKNVIKIAREFDWLKFTPVIVAESDRGIYFIIDGQHRTTAAAICGVKDVPCAIVKASRAQQAGAFAAINGNITVLSRMQIHAASIAAGDPKAVAVAEACALAGVTILAYPKAPRDIAKGDTNAVAAIYRCLDLYGRDTLVRALRCLTQTRDGNIGFVRAAIITALCSVLESEPAWGDPPKRLLRAIETFDFPAAFDHASAEARRGTGYSVVVSLVDQISAHLEQRLAA